MVGIAYLRLKLHRVDFVDLQDHVIPVNLVGTVDLVDVIDICRPSLVAIVLAE